ncbi:GlxA family transcriptional regulator [Jeongeupia naejangsanensis]|uniref:DJ-1/PfpI family protein n=1 Tax=Jeongeupia naejangsanensis TaxID=613195 RepID=A0ABS2BNE1_9NEIS|nr:helix-turn-helix domain-containing protein [Jeongeupia naejangsanensis]MBM3116588.1 DJ-1/PfpI family protein [Jeongeupia naejangsanensis]
MKPRHVVFVLYPDVNVLDVAGPLEVFSQPVRNGFAVPVPYRTTLASIAGGLVRSSAGAEFATVPLASVTDIDTLIVPGGQPSAPAVSAALRDWQPRVRRLASVCTGALILAAAGVLAGRRATTHWQYAAQLQAIDPSITVDTDAIYINDGMLWTSAGISAGIDLALALVEADLGHAVAMRIAKQMVVFLKRPGGQSQFSAALAAQSRNAGFAELIAWIAAHPDADLRVDVLAERMNMSPRSFARHFVAATGQTPAAAVEALRLDAACHLLTDTALPLKRVALDAGLGDTQTLRRVLLRHRGVNPQDYRARFGSH